MRNHFFLLALLCLASCEGCAALGYRVAYETSSSYSGPYGNGCTRTIVWVPVSRSEKQVAVPVRKTVRKAKAVRSAYPLALLRPVPGFITQGLHGKYHNALDFHAPIGTPVKAAASGQVISAGWDSQSGNMIKILHERGIETVYCHLSEFEVKKGDYVLQGQIIALSGDTGWDCRGAHLHFAVYGEPNPFARELVSYANAW